MWIFQLCEFKNCILCYCKLLRKFYFFRGKNCLKMRKSKTGEAHFRFSAPFYTHLCYISICRVISGIETAWKWEFLAADLCIFNSETSFLLISSTMCLNIFQKLLYLRKSEVNRRGKVKTGHNSFYFIKFRKSYKEIY